MNLIEQREAVIHEARTIAEGAKAAGRNLTADELGKINLRLDDAKSLTAKIDNAKASEDVLARLGNLGGELHPEVKAQANTAQEKTLGEHFVKHAASQLRIIRGAPGASLSTPEFKAATDTHVTGGPGGGFIFPQVDTSVVQAYRPQPVISDLLGSGTLSSQSITYFVEGAREGTFATVLEGGQKPQLHYNFSTLTESLTKIAGFIKISDEMIEDLAFLVSEINTRLLYDLSIFEEQQLLNGNGTAPNLRGLLLRSGIQTETAATADDDFDALFRAITKVQVATGLAADGLVIHPTDYQKLRLSKDANLQYLGGGPFVGQYGNGGVPIYPPLWGLRTIVSSAIAVGTALVGNYGQAATVYRKGGISVSSTNSNVNDFEHNLVTIRAEERLALAVRIPAAFVKVTLV